MDRRQFVGSSLALLSSAALGLDLGPVLTEQSNYADDFSRQLNRHPVLMGWQGLSTDIPPHRVSWQGKLPASLAGRRLYRNGPGLQQRGNVRYQHWFDGDGFVHQFILHPDNLEHQGRFVRTTKFNAESKAGRFLYSGTGSPVPNAKALHSNETINMANTALLPVAGELWALWEAGAPYRLDRDNLTTKGRLSFGPELDGLPFSAHPHTDSDGTIWNFGDLTLLGYPGMILYQLSPTGKLLRQQVLPIEPGYVHDFAVTERFLVFYLPPIKRIPAPVFVDTMIWQPQQEGRLLVLDKNTLSITHELPFDAGFIFHFGHATEHQGQITLNACWYQNADVMLSAMHRIADEDKLLNGTKAVLNRIHIDLNKRLATLESSDIAMEFIQFDPCQINQQEISHIGVGQGAGSRLFNAIVRVDADGGTDSFDFGKGVITEEPLYLPGDNAGEGYVINTSLHYLAGETRVSIFDAHRLSDGPIAQARLDRPLPLGFHGAVI